MSQEEMRSDLAGDAAASACLEAALETASLLESQGAELDAIEVLVRANRVWPDARLERRLVRLRRMAFESLSSSPGTLAPALPRALPIDASGLPMLPARGLTAGAVRFALESHGSLIVRGLLHDAAAAALRQTVDRALAARRDVESRCTPPSAWYDELEDVPRHGRDFSGKGGVHAADSPRGLFRLVETFHDAGVADLVADYFGEPPAITFQKTMLRCAQPGGGGSWHQDGAFLGADVRALNIWVSLTPSGRDAPGLSVIPRRTESLLPTGGIFSWDIGGKTILRCFPGVRPARPSFAPGDALIFDHLCVHSTFQSPQMTMPRYAVESWFFPRSAHPEGRTGLSF